MLKIENIAYLFFLFSNHASNVYIEIIPKANPIIFPYKNVVKKTNGVNNRANNRTILFVNSFLNKILVVLYKCYNANNV